MLVAIINQDISLNALAKCINSETSELVVVITTHAMFSSEKEQLRVLCTPNLEVFSECDFLTEEDYVDIDRRVCQRFNAMIGYEQTWQKVMDLILEERSRTVYGKITKAYGGDIRFAHCLGLGIFDEFWKSVGSKGIDDWKPLCEVKKNSLFKRIANRWNRSKKWAYWLLADNRRAVLNSGISRVLSRVGGEIQILPLTFFQRLMCIGSRSSIFGLTGGKILMSTWHEYSPSNSHPVYVLQDGHLPRDYSDSGILYLHSQDVFVPSNPFSEQWAVRNCHRVVRINGYSDPNFQPVANNLANGTKLKVLFALNHAGDWSPFIHRSDTDRLIAWVIDSAKNSPNIEFRIRTHPTMTHPLHEGINSKRRIEDVIANLAIPNLEMSFNSLADDLKWASIVASEYSQVLIDAWANGVLGISINVTNRRSFVKEYEDLGFPYFDPSKGFLLCAQAVESLINLQNNAVAQYNRAMELWRNS